MSHSAYASHNLDDVTVVVPKQGSCYALHFVGNNRVIFDIKGNTYRLIVVAEYRKGRLFVRFVGTHAEYEEG
jgi:mRNA-degrading endonuclease HigB of HigAB toxin-antitoxin module